MKSPILIQDYFIQVAKSKPEKVALVFEGKSYTYEKINKITDIIAINLIDLGLQRQDRATIYLENSPEIVLSLVATLKAGFAFVIINGAVQSGKLQYILKDSGTKIFVIHSYKLEIVNKVFKYQKLTCFIILVDYSEYNPQLYKFKYHRLSFLISEYSKLNDTRNFLEEIVPRCIDLGLATLIYSSRSTGDLKGVMSTHQNMIYAAQSIIEYLEPFSIPKYIEFIDELPKSPHGKIDKLALKKNKKQ